MRDVWEIIFVPIVMFVVIIGFLTFWGVVSLYILFNKVYLLVIFIQAEMCINQNIVHSLHWIGMKKPNGH
jgi:hypothetical protein